MFSTSGKLLDHINLSLLKQVPKLSCSFSFQKQKTPRTENARGVYLQIKLFLTYRKKSDPVSAVHCKWPES